MTTPRQPEVLTCLTSRYLSDINTTIAMLACAIPEPQRTPVLDGIALSVDLGGLCKAGLDLRLDADCTVIPGIPMDLAKRPAEMADAIRLAVRIAGYMRTPADIWNIGALVDKHNRYGAGTVAAFAAAAGYSPRTFTSFTRVFHDWPDPSALVALPVPWSAVVASLVVPDIARRETLLREAARRQWSVRQAAAAFAKEAVGKRRVCHGCN